MPPDMSDPNASLRTHLAPAVWAGLIFLAVSGLTRLVLMGFNYGEIAPAWMYIPASLLVGLAFDMYVAAWVTLPVALVALVLPTKWRQSAWIRWPAMAAAALYTFGLLYLAAVEYCFFDEFNSRLNYIAVDYLEFPHEVFINLRDTYPVFTVLIAAALLALMVTWLMRQPLRRAIEHRTGPGRRARYLGAQIVLIVAGYAALNIDSEKVSDNRALNEITGNGLYSLACAALTNELDYDQYYARIDEREARRRLRDRLGDDHCTFIEADTACPIARRVRSDYPSRRLNVVLVLEESLGSNFVGAVHPDGTCLTPQFDRLAGEHGLLFTRVYATGNRTVRGIEATLASFPPVPGQSIVKRPGSEKIFTLSSVLKERGYHTAFVYGGMSYFDNIGHFASTNGYDRVFDELDFERPTFKTIWGVCDEDLFAKSIAVCDSLGALAQPFFVTLLTVSNHTPYTFPRGRIDVDPNARRREHAVRYADYAIGKFIRDARSHAFFDSTLFVFLGDHGARVYGSQQIPMKSYEIPLLFYSPALYPTAARVDLLGSQMDVAPTILDLLGVEYDSKFFGRSLLSTAPDRQRAFLSHNRDVALMKDSLIAVLGIEGDRTLWRFEPATGSLAPHPVAGDSSLVRDAIAYYMVAYELFRAHRLAPVARATGEREDSLGPDRIASYVRPY